MPVDAGASATGTRSVAESELALSSLSSIDYADHFTRATAADATPERWARAMFGDTPNATELLIWRVLLGLRLSRGPSPDTVAGWRIGGRGQDWIRLEAASWLLEANLVVQATSDRVALGTFIRYGRWPAHLIWPPLSAIHRYVVPGLLRKAVNRASFNRVRTQGQSR